MAVHAAATAAITGVAIVPYGGILGGSPEYSNFDYKISAIDARSGELIWYREGLYNKSDIRSSGKLGNSFDSIFEEYVPKAKNPFSAPGKFKFKRSQLNPKENI